MTETRTRSGRPEPARPRADQTPWPGARLHVVTGKGGAGKTTVAAALAVALAADGRRVLLVEVEERQGLAQVLDTAPLGYEERHLVAAPGGGEVLGLAVDPHEALMEYLATFYKMRRAGKTLERVGAVDFATTVAPGLRDVLLTGKVFEAARRRVDADDEFSPHTYDAVVVDAPPTGRVVRFLGVSSDVAGLAKVGPIHRHAAAIRALFMSPRTVVHLVTLLEEMPAQETIDAIRELRRASFRVGGVIINAVRQPVVRVRDLAAVRDGEISAETIAQQLGQLDVADPAVLAEVLLDGGRDYAERIAVERRSRRRLERLEHPTFELPWHHTGIDVAGVYELADELREQGAA